jgi:hypothetical protein
MVDDSKMKSQLRVAVPFAALVFGLTGCTSTEPRPLAASSPTVASEPAGPTTSAGLKNELAFTEPAADLVIPTNEAVPSAAFVVANLPKPIRWPQILDDPRVQMCIASSMAPGVLEKAFKAPSRSGATAFLHGLRTCGLLAAFATSEELGNIALSDSSLDCVQNVYRDDAEATMNRLLVELIPGTVGDDLTVVNTTEIFACISPTERALIGDAVNLSWPLIPITDEQMTEFKPVSNALP